MVSPAGVWTPSLGAEPTLFISPPPALTPRRSSCSIIRCSAQKSSLALIFSYMLCLSWHCHGEQKGVSSMACRQHHNDSNVDPAQSRADSRWEWSHRLWVCVCVYVHVWGCTRMLTHAYMWKPGRKPESCSLGTIQHCLVLSLFLLLFLLLSRVGGIGEITISHWPRTHQIR